MEWTITRWDDPKLIYIAIAKVANTSVKAALLRSYVEDRRWPNPHDESVPYETATVEEIDTTYADYTPFAVVRNPYDRLVSFWGDKIVGSGWYPRFGALGFTRGQSFEDAARVAATLPDHATDPHCQSQCGRLVTADGVLLPSILVKFENLEDEWRKVQDVALRNGAAPIKSLKQRRVSKHNPWWTYYDDDLAQVVADRYAEDFARLGYSTAIEPGPGEDEHA